MILHLVLFRFKPGTDSVTIARAGRALLALGDQIPEIRAITFGPNLGPSAADYPHVLTVTADDLGAVQRYLDHPLHVETVAQYVAPYREARLAVDVELG